MLWAWDARPYPAFPARTDVWADGASWRRGHWLTGRAGLSGLDDVVRELCIRAEVDDIDVGGLIGAVSGYVVDAPAAARDVLEPLMATYDFTVAEREGDLIFFHRASQPPSELEASALTADAIAQPFAQRDAGDAPIEARVRFLDAARDYLIAGVSARRLDRADGGVATLEAPLVLEPDAAEALAQRALADRRAASEALHIAVGPAQIALEAGDRVAFGGSEDTFEIMRIEDAEARRLELHRVRRDGAAIVGAVDPSPPTTPPTAPTPAFSVLDLPPLPGHEDDERPLVAVFASPWLGSHDIYAGSGPSLRTSASSPAVIGELLWPLWPGPVDRWDDGNRFRIKLYGGALAGATRDDVLNGANAFAIESEGEWEIIQAAQCVLVAPGEYEISMLLRGRQGSAHAMQAPHAEGARIIKLDERLVRADLGAHEWHEPLTFIAPPAGALSSSNRAASLTATLPHAAARPWAPAHLRTTVDDDGDVTITWIRCARIGGDAWGPGEPPIGAPTEGYLVEILDGGDIVRTETVSVPSFPYSVADQTADFGSPPASLHIRIAQLGESGATGLNSELTITL
jgi:Putative phage tail protein